MASRKLDIRYVAGLADGEGSFSISYDKPGSKRSPRFVSQLTITNTCWPVLRKLKRQFGGSLHGQKRRAHYKLCGSWTLTAKAAAKVASKLLPYLQIKKRQAKLLIALSKHKKYTGAHPLSAFEIRYRKRLWKACWKLNGYNQKKRGPGSKHKDAPLVPS